MKNRVLIYIFAVVIGLLVTACTSDKPDARLLRAEALMTDSLKQARAMLDSIDRTTLNESDRHLFDLLVIKAKDKAFEQHTTDSAILKVADYYKHHQSTERYPEALYYAGRIYSDLGDYPSALEFYHKSLDVLPRSSSNIDLKGRIVSNLAFTLNALRMYDQALPYAKESLDIDYERQDTTDIVYSHKLMGITLMHADQYDKAEYHLTKGLNMADKYASDNVAASLQMYLAAVKYRKNEIDSALNMIRGVPEKITNSYHHTALTYALDIYLRSGIVDTAYMYAQELTLPENKKNWRIAYKKLLFSPLRMYVPADSLDTYYKRYGDIVEEFVENNGNEAALLENANYNYRRHDRERQKAELKSNRLSIMLLCLIVMILAITALALFIQGKRRKQLVQLHETIEHFMLLRANLEKTKREADLYRNQSKEYKDKADEYKAKAESLQRELDGNTIDIEGKKIADKRKLVVRLREEIKRLAEFSGDLPELPTRLVESEAYEELLRCVKNRKIIANNNGLWKSLEHLIAEYYPNFKASVTILFDGNIKEYTYRRLMLIKLRIKPSDMAVLLGIERGSISKERGLDCEKIFGSKEGSKYLDRAIILI